MNGETELRFIQTEKKDKDIRVDVFFSKTLFLSRNNVQKLLKNALITLAEQPIKQNYRIRGEELFVVEYLPPQPVNVEPENLPLDIIYQDNDLLIINKARGMVVHPAPGNKSGTLVNALLYHCRDLSGINGYIRPGIVHRLDKDTSGLMIVAKNDDAHVDLAAQIQNKTARREYLAVVHGRLKNDGEINTLIGRDPKDRQRMAVVSGGGRIATTRYEILEHFKEYTLISLLLLTGRTHQIRVHMAHIGHPVLGDSKYSGHRQSFAKNGQILHSRCLTITDLTGRRREFTAEPPPDMDKIIKNLRNMTR
jgi:23S rRNA pseudouridine1911/1915/1917 synthase